MNKDNLLFTTGEFSKLHNVNKRTLHYYDKVGLFSPLHKAENGYRYYTPYQSATFENILSLRELGMSIEEVKQYLDNPNSSDFMSLTTTKISEIDETIKKLNIMKSILKKKNEMLEICSNVYDGKIDTFICEQENLFMSNTNYSEINNNISKKEMSEILNHLKVAWSMSSFKLGCGSYINLDKIKNNDFTNYDGLFTVINNHKKNLFIKEKGLYLRAYNIGDCNKIPQLYKKIIEYANVNNLKLKGYSFERGMNEFVIKDESEYIVEITILCNKFGS